MCRVYVSSCFNVPVASSTGRPHRGRGAAAPPPPVLAASPPGRALLWLLSHRSLRLRDLARGGGLLAHCGCVHVVHHASPQGSDHVPVMISLQLPPESMPVGLPAAPCSSRLVFTGVSVCDCHEKTTTRHIRHAAVHQGVGTGQQPATTAASSRPTRANTCTQQAGHAADVFPVAAWRSATIHGRGAAGTCRSNDDCSDGGEQCRGRCAQCRGSGSMAAVGGQDAAAQVRWASGALRAAYREKGRRKQRCAAACVHGCVVCVLTFLLRAFVLVLCAARWSLSRPWSLSVFPVDGQVQRAAGGIEFRPPRVEQTNTSMMYVSSHDCVPSINPTLIHRLSVAFLVPP